MELGGSQIIQGLDQALRFYSKYKGRLIRKVRRYDLCFYVYSSFWVENGWQKISGYCSSPDKNSAALDKVEVIEMEKNGRRDGERKGEERRRKAFLFLFFFISKITFVKIYVNNSFLCVCVSDKRTRE